ncbi:2-aminoethylphosphonate:pyruvateaminotransferas e-like protein [Strigomonas culicis]|uniref:2-aminoethylphosphonate:pyruvateaminotransferas e-like protein n=1 Tax=Strigomonas culicis TaxID=28005 RepID=S9W1Z4_9TRYP|nr:2-aminoethylphosphonate:pyruvateaminotransferas e-like protein [Strigomonas culicis]EPY32024.1 2-aminoethylphosphonate:pyruvateaminotransferas e-like protein [Strigomonas culicis]EPY33506.1 2-aminoethylphosphonate:pyruvateaminotransferas e-like protein [Strigomonas culicis]|eukprot:EPY26275.1 2-aminoethylphosphonate:pyruvateaminotransferas e-like protein [Strigomonas culicis]
MASRQILFTAGPLHTSETVKAAQMTDYGSRDQKFMDAVKYVREKMVKLCRVDPNEWSCILQPGAGTMAIEACIQTLFPQQGGKYLLINSGKYSERQGEIVEQYKFPMVTFVAGEGKDIDMDAFEKFVKQHPDVTTVGYVHHETSTGMVYPAEKIAAIVRKHVPNAVIIADCMSSFGGILFDVINSCDIFVTSANKCLHSVPGVAIVVGRRSLIAKAKGNARSNTLDLSRQLASFEKSGQFRITPPVQCVMALQQAIKEYIADGGLRNRRTLYAAKSKIVCDAGKKMGFTLFLNENRPSFAHIVVCFNMPTDPRWNFKKFYQFLNSNGFVIYPGKASHAETFRIGLMGHTTLDETKQLMSCCKDALAAMGIDRLQPGNSKL